MTARLQLAGASARERSERKRPVSCASVRCGREDALDGFPVIADQSVIAGQAFASHLCPFPVTAIAGFEYSCCAVVIRPAQDLAGILR